ncbi:MAG: hypothetical protein ACLS48_12695 [[Eubacterium] siraeum]
MIFSELFIEKETGLKYDPETASSGKTVFPLSFLTTIKSTDLI